MNPRYFKQLIIFALFAVMTAGCKKWLDVSPKTQIRQRELFENEQGFLDALTGVYLKLGSSNLYGQQMTYGLLDVMAQCYNITFAGSDNASNTFRQAGVYNYADDRVKARIAAIWSETYACIANLDNLLVQIDEKKKQFTLDNFERVKGQALALRAYLHFDLLRLFGTAPVVDGNKPSIPYVTTFGVGVYPLLPVNDVIAHCLKDLGEAEQLLDGNKEVDILYSEDPTSNYMNYWAVKGLEARIHLYAGDKPKALAAAQEVIGNQQLFPFVEPSRASATINRDRLYATEHLFTLQVYKLKDYAEAYTKSSSGLPLLSTTTSKTRALFETTSGGSSDIRFNYSFVQIGSGYATSKYWQEATNTYLKNIVPMVRLSEMYYIAAECAATTEEGVGYLNTVRHNRGLAQLNTNITADKLKAEILKEYKKECYGEGQLFYYFKRINNPLIDGSSKDATRVYVLPLPEDEVEFGKRFE
ncbi:RagB/SusD family nutrient uptake outer membrane protein [Chitinophaga sp. NPDC101104]|uniref:RagB/SusD family nutrient uptake outer membrane protein n=1 Tax=Chitinophaga sp. NPDC101104 TaxID=3390561 RepID=UPI003D0638EF